MNWETVIRECARTEEIFGMIGAVMFFAGLAGLAVAAPSERQSASSASEAPAAAHIAGRGQ